MNHDAGGDYDAMQREAFVERLMVLGTAPSTVKKQTRAQFSMTGPDTEVMMGRIRQRWLDEYASERNQWKMAAIRRVSDQIQRLLADAQKRDKEQKDWEERAKLDPKIKIPPNVVKWKFPHDTYVQLESFLSLLQGTREPIQFNVNVALNQAMAQIVATLTPDQVADMLAEYEELERLAGVGRQVIDTTGEPIDQTPGLRRTGS